MCFLKPLLRAIKVISSWLKFGIEKGGLVVFVCVVFVVFELLGFVASIIAHMVVVEDSLQLEAAQKGGSWVGLLVC